MNDDEARMPNVLRGALEKMKDEARADERARCMKVLEDLRDGNGAGDYRDGVSAAIAALSEAPTSPVASSPVGGEHHDG